MNKSILYIVKLDIKSAYTCSLRIEPMTLLLQCSSRSYRYTAINIKLMLCDVSDIKTLLFSCQWLFFQGWEGHYSVLSLYNGHHSNITNCTIVSVCFGSLWLATHLLTSFCVEGKSCSHFTFITNNMKYVHPLSTLLLPYSGLVFLSPLVEKESPEDNSFVCDVKSVIQLKRCVSVM